MKYEILYTRRSARDVEKLSPEVRGRIGKAMTKLQEDPYPHLRKLVNTDIGEYRYRIGEYRVILDIVGQEIIVLRVGHRREIYRHGK